MADFPAPRPGTKALVLLLAVGGALPILGALLLCVVAFAPTSMRYTLDADGLTIEANLGPLGETRTYPRAELGPAEVTTFPGGTRAFGTAMPGYCEGEWTVPGGRARLMTDCGRDVVRIEAAGETVYISPPDPAAFVADLRAGQSRVDTLPPAPRSGFLGGLAVVVVGAALATVWIFSRVPRGGLLYTVADGTLVVPAHLSPVRLPLSGARAHRGPMKGWRVAGTALPGVLYLGNFRSDGPVHCAATRLDDGWWIEGSHRVYVTPADMDGFGRALAAAGVVVA